MDERAQAIKLGTVRIPLYPWIICLGCGLDFHAETKNKVGQRENNGFTCPWCGDTNDETRKRGTGE